MSRKPCMDIEGRRFGRVIVLGFSHIDKNSYWKCKCDCGKEFIAIGNNLKRGKTISCGCFRKELNSSKYKKHGLCRSRFYGIWCSMIRRCLSDTDKNYSNYKGRGITVCDSWRSSFEDFRSDMHESYVEHCGLYGEKDTTLDRINTNGNYENLNCRWATKAEQSRNRRPYSEWKFKNKEVKNHENTAISSL
jgi:hypothetical protein